MHCDYFLREDDRISTTSTRARSSSHWSPKIRHLTINSNFDTGYDTYKGFLGYNETRTRSSQPFLRLSKRMGAFQYVCGSCTVQGAQSKLLLCLCLVACWFMRVLFWTATSTNFKNTWHPSLSRQVLLTPISKGAFCRADLYVRWL